jgi:hypothetical protein
MGDLDKLESAMRTIITIICHSATDKFSVTENLGYFTESKLRDTREAADACAMQLQAKAGGPDKAEIRVHDLRRRAA